MVKQPQNIKIISLMSKKEIISLFSGMLSGSLAICNLFGTKLRDKSNFED